MLFVVAIHCLVVVFAGAAADVQVNITSLRLTYHLLCLTSMMMTPQPSTHVLLPCMLCIFVDGVIALDYLSGITATFSNWWKVVCVIVP